ncbi:MAG: glycosyltransferase [Flavobacteriia bacterium]|jgi:glycosyltransferase involved in cell wall biosynthesis
MHKILILSDINSAHTQKWVRGILSHGFEVCVFSLSEVKSNWFEDLSNFSYRSCAVTDNVANKKSIFGKSTYLNNRKTLKKYIEEIKPAIVHAHYATSYGLLGALSDFHPYILSVWGSDVYDFPKKSIIHKKLFQFNLRKADFILSTSKIMAKEISKYSRKDIMITPFGVDLDMFKKMSVTSLFDEKDIVIGTIKSFEQKYGIDLLIHTFHKLTLKHPDLPLKLLLVGDGTERMNLENLVDELKLRNRVLFTGKIPQNEVPKYQNMFDVYVALSIDNSESFGVATIEAMACEKPVVVSDVDGFSEVVVNNETGIIVPRKNSEQAGLAIEKLLFDKEFYEKCAKQARLHVQKHYEWKNNLQEVIDLYNKIIKK